MPTLKTPPPAGAKKTPAKKRTPKPPEPKVKREVDIKVMLEGVGCNGAGKRTAIFRRDGDKVVISNHTEHHWEDDFEFTVKLEDLMQTVVLVGEDLSVGTAPAPEA